MTFSIVWKSPQPNIVYKNYAFHKLTYLIYHHGMSWCDIIPPLLTHVWKFQYGILLQQLVLFLLIVNWFKILYATTKYQDKHIVTFTNKTAEK